MSGVVYKQWYKSRNAVSSTAILNRKHLVYIATRPGAVHNLGCAFGLWGRLPGVAEPENINDLRLAKRIVTEASADHTLWRAVISVDDDTAKRHDLYDRKTWEKLLARKINVLAEEMGIKKADFCWLAAMHYEKGHPHVHILYWDKSDAIHSEHVAEERFGIMAEHVRAEFGREIYHEEIAERQKAQDEEVKALRLELRAMLKEVNLAEALDLSHITQPVRDELTAQLAELAATAPTSGALKYAYLKPEYKEKMDSFIDRVLTISDFRKAVKRYEAATAEISAYYGNGKEKQLYEHEKALAELRKDLGNEVLATIKQYRKELALEAPAERGELYIVLRSTAETLLAASPGYRELLEIMPKERTPTGALLRDESFRRKLDQVIGEIMGDVRIHSKINGYLNANTGERGDEDLKAFRRDGFQDARKEVSSLIVDKLRSDAGYPEQERADLVTNLLIRLLGDASRSGGRQEARRDLHLHRSKELSKTAQKDRRAKLEQHGSWPTAEI